MKKLFVSFIAIAAIYAAVASQLGAAAGNALNNASQSREAKIEAMSK